MAASGPTRMLVSIPVQCGRGLAPDGGLWADQDVGVDPGPMWEGACPRWRPLGRPGCWCRSRSNVGGGLPPMAASGPTRMLVSIPVQCGRGLAPDGGLWADQDVGVDPGPMWEGACPRWRPLGRPGCWIRSSTYPFLRSRLLWVPPLRRLTFEKRKSKQNALAPPLGTSPGLGVPSLRLESVGRRNGPSMAQCG
ncbi:hypothetical protein C4J97_3817 [Pseudomonas orientalis]|nr:hypothetical protein C4J97_3817 [Pseudomonas orientalis]